MKDYKKFGGNWMTGGKDDVSSWPVETGNHDAHLVKFSEWVYLKHRKSSNITLLALSMLTVISANRAIDIKAEYVPLKVPPWLLDAYSWQCRPSCSPFAHFSPGKTAVREDTSGKRHYIRTRQLPSLDLARYGWQKLGNCRGQVGRIFCRFGTIRALGLPKVKWDDPVPQ